MKWKRKKTTENIKILTSLYHHSTRKELNAIEVLSTGIYAKTNDKYYLINVLYCMLFF